MLDELNPCSFLRAPAGQHICICRYTHTYTHMHSHMHTYIYVHICIHMHIRRYMHTHTLPHSKTVSLIFSFFLPSTPLLPLFESCPSMKTSPQGPLPKEACCPPKPRTALLPETRGTSRRRWLLQDARGWPPTAGFASQLCRGAALHTWAI